MEQEDADPRDAAPSRPLAGRRRPGAVATAVAEIRELIRSRELLPGEPIRQEDMARRLGMSRVPVREALGALEREGTVRHSPNQGFFVAKLGVDELDQIYEMRRLLETALLRAIEWPEAERLGAIDAMNEELARAAEQGDVARVVTLNRRFHDAIFGLSPLHVIHREVQRLWEMSESYRALYLYRHGARVRVVREHRAMVAALGRRDADDLVAQLDAHRAAGQREVAALLGRPEVDGQDARAAG